MKKRKASKKAGRKATKRSVPGPGSDALVRLPPPDPGTAAVVADPARRVAASEGALFHDGRLLPAFRTRWQFAEWAELTTVDEAALERDVDRAKLAALVAAAHSHLGETDKARAFSERALAWGCDRRLLARVMISAMQNSLGLCAAALDETETALEHFHQAVALVEPSADARLLGRTRFMRETARRGMIGLALQVAAEDLSEIKSGAARSSDGVGAEVERLDRALAGVDLPGIGPRRRRPYTVVIAGVPRSGSTWAYNAARLLLAADGRAPHAAWRDDYRPEAHPEAPAHLVKVHNAEHLDFAHDVVITTTRDMAERLASLIRMGWLKRTPEAVRGVVEGQKTLYEFWRRRSDLEIDYAMIRNAPQKAVHAIADAIGVPCNARRAGAIVDQLDQLSMPAPGEGPDPVTLLHPNHRGDSESAAEITAWVRRVLAGDPGAA